MKSVRFFAASLLAATSVLAAELPPELTPVGAERAGSADGTIPAWSGGSAVLDDAVNRDLPEEPLYVITADNYESYRSLLSLGHQALFRQYQTYQMPVYKTRRTASYPLEIYEATSANLGRAQLHGADGVKGAKVGFPFPVPKSGAEILWNHRLRYRGESAEWETWAVVVLPDGAQKLNTLREKYYYVYANPELGSDKSRSEILFYNKLHSDTRFCPNWRWVWHEPLNPTTKERGIWAKCGDLRTFRFTLGHDDTSLGSEGLRKFDMLDMFTGEFDRYTYRLLGKRPLLVPYNSQRFNDGDLALDARLDRSHLKQDRARYEVHRVWVVDATLRPGATHEFPRRVFYIDEDSWTILLVELYQAGNLTRFQEGHLLYLPELQAPDLAPQLVYDLTTRRYFASRLVKPSVRPKFNMANVGPSDFSPAALSRE